MSKRRGSWPRLRGWRCASRPESVRQELEAHVAHHVDEAVRRGVSPTEARRDALVTLGGVSATVEACHDARRLPVLDALAQDLRVSVRLLRKHIRFTATVVTVLAVSIALNSTMFTFVDAALLSPMPFPRPDEVVALATRQTDRPVIPGPPGFRGVSYPEYLDWRAGARSFADMAAYAEAPLIVGDDTQGAERAAGAFVEWQTFALIGQGPIIGRGFRPDDDREGAAAVVLLGYDLWRTRYAADTAVLGRTIRVGGVPSTVIGVMPPTFGFPQSAQLWQPLAHMPGLSRHPRATRSLAVIARLAPGVTVPWATAELRTIAARLAASFPDTNQHVDAVVMPWSERHVAPQVTFIILALMGTVGCVRLVACANIANLLLTRGVTRGREMATRLALGATRGRLVRQLLVESLVVASVGGMIGVGLTAGALGSSARSLRRPTRRTGCASTSMYASWRLVGVLCLGTTILCGLVPARLTVPARCRVSASSGPRCPPALDTVGRVDYWSVRSRSPWRS